jgi:hypothetical protein
MTAPTPPTPRVVVPNTTLRETLFAIACGVLVLGFVIYGVMSMGAKQQPASANMLSGKVVAKKFIPGPQEQEISFGSKGVRTKTHTGEYLLEVRVESEQRTFTVPVDPSTYQAARIGDRQTFLRPRSEQQH